MLKNLANCSPKEFLVQTNKIRYLAKEFITDTDILNWRANIVTDEVKSAAADEREDMVKSNILSELDKILDILLEKDIDRTVALLCYCCFIDPKDEGKYKVTDIIESITEMVTDPAVISFFTRLTGSRLKSSSQPVNE